MPQNFGVTPLSTTTLSNNQFPVSAGFVPGTASGNLTSIQLGPSSTDSNGYVSAPVAMYIADGSDIALGSSTDANTVNSVMGRLTKIRDLLNATLTVSVSGTVAVTQSGTWNINNVAGTVSLPTGAATAAKQPALGTAGTASTDVLTVQGIASMTPLAVSGTFWQATQPVSGSGNFTVVQGTGTNLHTVVDSGSITATTNADTTIGGTSAPSKGLLAIGKSNDGTPQYQPLPEGAGGRSVIVEGFVGGTAVPVSGTFWQATQPVSGTLTVQQATGSNLHAVLDASSAVIGHVVTDSGSTTAVTQSTASSLNAQVVGATASGASNAGNPVKVAAVYNSTQPTVTTGQIVDNQATARGALIVATGVEAFAVNASQTGTWTVQQGGSNWSINTAQVAGTTTDTNTGNASAGTQRVVIASNQPAIPASQSGSWTVTANAGTGTFTNQQSNITADYDTGVGTQNLTMFGIALPASGGAVSGGTSTNPVRIDPTGVTTQPVSGTVSITANSSVNVAQVAGTTTDTNSGNKSAGTMRVVIATDQPSLSNALSVSQSGSWTVTANAGTNLNTSALALDTSVNGILLSQASTTSGQKGPIIQGAVTTNAPTYVTAQTNPLSLDTSGLLRVSLKDTPANTNNLNVALAASSATVTVSASGNFNNASIGSTGSAVPASASYIGANKSGNLTGLSLDGSGNLNVNVAAGSASNAAASATGSAVPASADYTGINVAGTLRGQTGVNPSGSVYAAQSDITSVAGSTVATAASGIIKVGLTDGSGNAITSTTNAIDVNIKSGGGSGFSVVDETAWTAGTSAFAPTGGVFNDSAAALTSGQEGTVRLTNNRAIHVNLRDASANQLIGSKTSANSIPVVVASDQGAVAIGVASGTALAADQTNTILKTSLYVKKTANADTVLALGSATSANSVPVVVASDQGAIPASQSGTWTVQPGNTQNSTAWLTQDAADGPVAAGTAASKSILGGLVYNTSAPTPTNGQQVATQADQAGNLRVFSGVSLAALSAWNSSTGLNATQTIFTNSGAKSVLVQLTQTTTISAGAATFEVSYDGSTWVTIPANNVVDPTSATFAQISLPYTLQASTNKQFLLLANGAQGLRIKLSTQITGSGTVTPNYALLPFSPIDQAVVFSPTAANFQVIANAGTNLNTSLLALESGGNLATLAGGVSANKYQVNVSQINGVAPTMGNGVSGTGVQRVTIASDSTGQVTLATGSAVIGHVIVDSGSTTAVTQATASSLNAQVVGSVASAGSNAGNPVKVGGAYNSTQPTVTTGQIVDAQYTARGAAIVATGVDTFTVTANAGTNLNTSTLALESGGNLATIAGAIISQGTALGSIKELMVAGSVTTNAPTYTTGNINPLSLDTAGLLRVSIKDTPANTNNLNVNLAASAATVTVSATNLSTNVAQIGGTNVVTGGASGLLAVGGPVASGASNADNPVKTGGVFNSTQPTVTTGQVVDLQATSRGALIVATGTDTFTVTANAGTNLNTSALALDTSVNGILLSQASTTSGQKGPLVQGAVTTNAPSYTTAQTSPLSLDTSGLLRASLKDTPSNTNNLNVNLAASAATVTVTATNLQTNLNQIAGSSVSTAATGVQKVGVVGNAGATLDSTVGAGTAPTNAIAIAGLYNTSAPAPTNGQAMALQLDQAGNVREFPGIALATLSAWNSGTSLNATQNIFTNSGAEAVLVQLTQTTTLTAGAVTFEVTYDGSNWGTIPANCVLDPTSTTFAQISIPYTVQASTNKQFLLNMNGAQGLRVKLSTQITGSGSVTPNYALLPASPADTVIALSPTAANFNVTAVQSGTWADNITQIAGASIATAASGIMKVGLTDGSGTALNSTSNALNVSAVQNGTWTVQPGNTANTTAWLVQAVAGTTGGSTPYHLLSANSNNATSLKASAGTLYGYNFSNTNASARWVKFYNKASAPAPASDTVVWAVQVPGNGVVAAAFPEGMSFSTGIAFAAVVNASDTDNTSVGASDLSIDIRYK